MPSHTESLLVRTYQEDIVFSYLYSAYTFAAYFANILHSDDNLPILHLPTPTISMENLYGTTEAVAAIFTRLDLHKSVNPDGLNPRLLRLHYIDVDCGPLQ